ncbi:hypothetical protein FGIG_07000, partial [Fasciola gigantica]
ACCFVNHSPHRKHFSHALSSFIHIPLSLCRFQASPAPILYVSPRDEVVFVCSHESLYILWTYERLAMESCSMWLDNRVTVRLLFKCPSTFNHSRIRRYTSAESLSSFRTSMSKRPKADPQAARNTAGSNSSVTSVGLNPHPRSRLRKAHRVSRYVDQRGITGTGPATTAGELSTQNPMTSQLDRFTLLIDEFAWVNGNPRFAIDRPVYFMAQSSLCRANNMRVAIVHGTYHWDKTPTALKSNRDSDPSECDATLLGNRKHIEPTADNCNPALLDISKSRRRKCPINWLCSKPTNSLPPSFTRVAVFQPFRFFLSIIFTIWIYDITEYL